MKLNFLEAVLAATILAVMVSAFAQTWTQTSAPNAEGGWEAVALSADGRKAVAVTSTSPPAVSADSGVTWTTNAVYHSFNRIAASADGTRFVASSSSGVYVSANSGGNWLLVNTNSGQVVCSADGTKLAIGGRSIYTSSDSGMTWVSNNAPVAGGPYDSQITCSADGCKMFAVRYGSPGVWTRQLTPVSTLNINSSASASAVLSWLVPSTNFVLQQNSVLSTVNWVTVTNAPTLNFTNLREEVFLSVSNQCGFFRLSAQ